MRHTQLSQGEWSMSYGRIIEWGFQHYAILVSIKNTGRSLIIEKWCLMKQSPNFGRNISNTEIFEGDGQSPGSETSTGPCINAHRIHRICKKGISCISWLTLSSGNFAGLRLVIKDRWQLGEMLGSCLPYPKVSVVDIWRCNSSKCQPFLQHARLTFSGTVLVCRLESWRVAHSHLLPPFGHRSFQKGGLHMTIQSAIIHTHLFQTPDDIISILYPSLRKRSPAYMFKVISFITTFSLTPMIFGVSHRFPRNLGLSKSHRVFQCLSGHLKTMKSTISRHTHDSNCWSYPILFYYITLYNHKMLGSITRFFSGWRDKATFLLFRYKEIP